MSETVAPPSGPTVRARHAASLVPLRATDDGPAMLMGMRGAKHKFAPNKLVFPGGSVDPGDARAPVAAPVSPHVQMMLEKSSNPRLARALTVAAARELEEETGLTLGQPPDLSGFDYLGRAVTPPGRPIRFNARFFVVDAAAITGTLAGSGELDDLRWWPIEEALALDLALPTRTVITLLQAWMLLSPADRAGRTQTPALKNRKLVLE